jgi:hypothetical protein
VNPLVTGHPGRDVGIPQQPGPAIEGIDHPPRQVVPAVPRRAVTA